MTDQGKTIHQLVWQARRAKGLTQAELARIVGCKQSAISMFEAGKGDALSKEKVAVIAEKLGLDAKSLQGRAEPVDDGGPCLKYCPVQRCDSNIPTTANGEPCLRPTLVEAPAAEKTHCGSCSELLQTRCPNDECRAPVSEDIFCPQCGTAYVTVTHPPAEGAAEAWADGHRRRLLDVRSLSATRRRAAP